jgi:hypothetical protein
MQLAMTLLRFIKASREVPADIDDLVGGGNYLMLLFALPCQHCETGIHSEGIFCGEKSRERAILVPSFVRRCVHEQ